MLAVEEFDAVSDASPAVPCSTEHTTQTFLVTRYTGPFAGQETRPNQQQLKSATARLCPVDSLRSFLEAGPRDATLGVSITAYFPGREEWAAGSRAVRCDLHLSAPDGTVRPATGDLRDFLTTPQSAAVRLCYRQEAKDGALSSDGKDVPCSEEHTAEDVSAWFPADAKAASPADRNRRCLPYALEFLGSNTLPDGVVLRPVIRRDGGAATVRCAIAPGAKGTAAVTGTLAPHAKGGAARG